MTSPSPDVAAVGWELHCTTGGSDKFYRFMAVGSKAVTQWGARGAVGQFQVKDTADMRAAATLLFTKMSEKERKGYLVATKVTRFTVSAAAAAALETSATSQLTALAQSFQNAVRTSGTTVTSPGPVDVNAVKAEANAAVRHAASPAPASPAPASGGGRGRSRRPLLPPVGPCIRPNGTKYLPRLLGGHEDVALLRAARTRHEHVVLTGPPGTGKTALIEAAFPDAEQLVGSADTAVADLVGTWVQDPDTGAFVWADGPLTRSVRNDVPLFIDEIALIDSRVLSPLYAPMDGRGVLKVEANPLMKPLTVGDGWFLVAAYNPDVPGAAMSEALLDRFEHHAEVGTDFDMARAELGVSADLVTVAKNLDARRRRRELTWSPQLRALLTFKAQEEQYGVAYALAALVRKAPEADRATLGEELEKKFGPVEALGLGGRYTV